MSIEREYVERAAGQREKAQETIARLERCDPSSTDDERRALKNWCAEYREAIASVVVLTVGMQAAHTLETAPEGSPERTTAEHCVVFLLQNYRAIGLALRVPADIMGGMNEDYNCVH